jgi:outer membrane protein TolC
MSRARILLVTGLACLSIVAPPAVHAQDSSSDAAARHLTLDEAQRTAVQANAGLARLGQLSVEAAEHHRRSVQADYFPKISATAWNLHFNKFMGEQIAIERPLIGTTATLGLPLLGQDQSYLTMNILQPVTPLFKVRQAVILARADENIARAKAGLPVAESRQALTKTYFELLIAQKELALVDARVRNAHTRRTLASNASTVVVNTRLEAASEDVTTLTEDLVDLSTRVQLLTASLNERLGWPADTPLELEAPRPLVERLTLGEAISQALATNPEVIEAEQNVRKAKAGTEVSKLDYIPDIAVFGGFGTQNNVIPLLPNSFAYVGIMGSYNVFDSGKREQTLKERSTQLEMARTALELTRAKVAAGVKTSYLELERSRTLSDMARATDTDARLRDVRDDGLHLRAAGDQITLEQIRLDWRHRLAYAELKAAIGDR